MATTQKDKRRLLAAARMLAARLKLSDHGAAMRIRVPARGSKRQTDGWRVVIGDLGKNQPRLELWLDRFTGYTQPKFWACFYSENLKKLAKITKRISRQLWPVRTITVKDTSYAKFFALTKRLDHSALAKPILEKYSGQAFFGIYDPAPRASDMATNRFCNRAAAFFIQVAESLPQAKGQTIERTDFPRCEDRKLVKAHLWRERSGYLALQCKERDNFRCRVCKKTFGRFYGEKLGNACAEAHHLKPLAQQGNKVRTEPTDLITVCANCHRALHRMNGEVGDVAKLSFIVRKPRK